MLTKTTNDTVRVGAGIALAVLAAAGAWAQDGDGALDWVYGPRPCPIGGVAEIELPEGYQFVGKQGTQQILEWLGNPVSGDELGLVMPAQDHEDAETWFVVFEFDPIGYVRDDDRDDLDADKLLASIREGNEHANEERRRNGWTEVHVRGWRTAPYYDTKTNNLKWAITGEADGAEIVNFSTRLLGRGGVMSADLVVDPGKLEESLAAYEQMLGGFSFATGNRYAEFRDGDKVAQYGLTALVAGGAGAVAMKSGLLARFWKFIVLGLVAVFGFFRRLLARLFGRE